MTKKKTPKKRKRLILTEEELQRRGHIKDIRTTMANIGFHRINGIDGNNFVYNSRESELDDIFVYENLILLAEYTSVQDVSTHLLKKKVFYDLVNNSHRDFIEFAIEEPKLKAFSEYYKDKLKNTYQVGQLRIRIIYCSIKTIDTQLKDILKDNKSVYFYDYNKVHYFKSLSTTIKRSARYELYHFLKVKASEIGNCVSDLPGSDKYKGNILPVEKSSFKDGHNIISFYIDAASLIRRAYVLRQESWREDDAGGFYQRMVIGKKISSMRKYLANEGRVFINNIIATLSNDSTQLLDSDGEVVKVSDKGLFEGNESHDQVMPAQVQIEDLPNIIGIIDGQHRVYAYHEGTDVYEEKIAELRVQQHLLVTAVLFPKTVSVGARRQFEATLFREINNNQTNISSQLKQDIDVMISPFSSTSICKGVISKLNESGPLSDLISVHSYDKGKLKTASIVSYGLIPLVKYDDSSESDSLYRLWTNPDKSKLNKDCEEFELKKQYVDFCAEKIRDILIALKRIVPKESWCVYDPKKKQGTLSVTFINGFLNVIRCQIKDTGALLSSEDYYQKLKDIKIDKLKEYKSSQYNKMGNAIYSEYIKCKDSI